MYLQCTNVGSVARETTINIITWEQKMERWGKHTNYHWRNNFLKHWNPVENSWVKGLSHSKRWPSYQKINVKKQNLIFFLQMNVTHHCLNACPQDWVLVAPLAKFSQWYALYFLIMTAFSLLALINNLWENWFTSSRLVLIFSLQNKNTIGIINKTMYGIWQYYCPVLTF